MCGPDARFGIDRGPLMQREQPALRVKRRLPEKERVKDRPADQREPDGYGKRPEEQGALGGSPEQPSERETEFEEEQAHGRPEVGLADNPPRFAEEETMTPEARRGGKDEPRSFNGCIAPGVGAVP